MNYSVQRTGNASEPYCLFYGPDCVLAYGPEDEMYRIKHHLEKQEQDEANEDWAINLIERYHQHLTGVGGLHPEAAESKLRSSMPMSYALWKKHQVLKPQNA